MKDIFTSLKKSLFTFRVLELIILILIGVMGWYYGHKTAIESVEKTTIKQLQVEATKRVIDSLFDISSSFIAIRGFLKYSMEDDDIKKWSVDNRLHEKLKDSCFYSFEMAKNFFRVFESHHVVLNEFVPQYHGLFQKDQNDVMPVYTNFLTYLNNLYDVKVSKGICLNEEEINQIKDYREKVIYVANDMLNYISHFKIDLQNYYYGDLFDYQIPKIKPRSKMTKTPSPDDPKTHFLLSP